ncbi:MAG: serine protease [Candidatus Diapherotrites archaeon]
MTPKDRKRKGGEGKRKRSKRQLSKPKIGKRKAKKEKIHNIEEKMDKVYVIIGGLAILTLVSIVFSAISFSSTSNIQNILSSQAETISESTSSRISDRFMPKLNEIGEDVNNLNRKLVDINNALWLESEQHFLEVMNKVDDSIVAVIAAPIKEGREGLGVIYVDNLGNEGYIGAGFSINSAGHILTARHNVDGFETILLMSADGTIISVPKEIILYPPSGDLALIPIKTDIPSVELLEQGTLDIGSNIGFIGFPIPTKDGAIVETKATGTISGFYYYEYRGKKVPAYVIHSLATHGNSGGPIFSMKTGKVGGMINQGISENIVGIALGSAFNKASLGLPNPS